MEHEVSIYDYILPLQQESNNNNNNNDPDDTDEYDDIEDSRTSGVVGGDSTLILKRGDGMNQLDKWQLDSAVATWKAMRQIMPAQGWSEY